VGARVGSGVTGFCWVKNELTRPAPNAYPKRMEITCCSGLEPILEVDNLDWDLSDLRAAVAEAQQAVNEGRVTWADEAFAALLARNLKQ
jgi:hypothetical protein